MSSRTEITITYKCCGASYRADVRIFPSVSAVIPALDRLHALDHPECPPLDSSEPTQ